MKIKLPFVSEPNTITNNDYHNSEDYKKFSSSSELKLLLISPMWMRYCQDNPKSTIGVQAAQEGSAYHDILSHIVNGTSFEDASVIFEPPINPKSGNPFGYDTIKFKDAMDLCTMENPGKLIYSSKEIILANTMIDNLLNGNPHLSNDVKYLIKKGQAEKSYFTEYQGAFFKFRPDLVTKTKIIDWKTCRHQEPKPENWSRKVHDMGYDISASFYQFFDFIITGKWKPFYWIAQEKEPPYDFNILSADDYAYRIEKDGDSQIPIPGNGALKFRKLLEQYILCTENNEWPGYSIFINPDRFGRRIATPIVPGWEKKKMFNFYNVVV
jgi:hypothetical protein